MNSTTAPTAGALDHTFTATLTQEPGKGGWTYVRMEGSAAFFATRGLVKVSGTIDGQPFTSSFMALGDGTHKLPVKAAIRHRLGKHAGDTVTVHLDQRLPHPTPKEHQMSPTKTHIAGIRAVGIPVENQDDALRFYADTLGFTTLRDAPTPAGGRFIELAPGHTGVVITLEPAAPNVTRGAIGIRFITGDADNARAALVAAGVDTDEILRWPGVPAMFSFRDPDGNAFSITEVA